jgi:hypothetical protein
MYDLVFKALISSRTFESTVLSKLLAWASSTEKSLNQPTLPHAIIASNHTDVSVDEVEWDVEIATERLLATVAGSIHRDAKYKEYSDFRMGREKDICNMRDLLLCCYSSVNVVRIPKKGRYMLINK